MDRAVEAPWTNVDFSWADREPDDALAPAVIAYRAARETFIAGQKALFPAGTYWLRRFAGALCESDASARAPAAAPA